MRVFVSRRAVHRTQARLMAKFFLVMAALAVATALMWAARYLLSLA